MDKYELQLEIEWARTNIDNIAELLERTDDRDIEKTRELKKFLKQWEERLAKLEGLAR